jgi:cysteine desulfurase / selenocysteine lyase
VLTEATRLRDFPSLRGRTYLNTAAEGIPPLCVRDALQQYWDDKLEGAKGRDGHFARLEQCREVAARFLGLQPAEVSFCSCSSEAYNLLATALAMRAGDEVVVNDLDFPAGVTPWLIPGAASTLRVWKSREGVAEHPDLEALLSARTRLVQVSLVSFYNGYRLDWSAFVATVRRRAPAAVIAVDVTQALGRCVIDCAGADFIVSSTHKWVLGIHGGGIVGIPAARSKELTARAGGWFNLANAFGPERFERAEALPGARSYSAGMPSFAPVYALNASLRYVESIGVGEIAAHADPCVRRAHEGLLSLGLQPLAPLSPERMSGIVAFKHEKADGINQILLAEKVHCHFHAGRLRLALHAYNDLADVDRFLEVMKRALHETR